MVKNTIWILLLVGLLMSGCAAKEETFKTIKVDGGSFYEVNVDQFTTMMEDKNFTLVNVHIPFEGDLPSTDVTIPYNEIDQHLEELPADKNAQIFLYCRSGNMSATAAETLVKLGYTNVWHLAGGFTDWKKAGNPMAE